MIDGAAMKAIRPVLDGVGNRLASAGVSPNAVSVAGFFIGVLAALAIVAGWFAAAAALTVASRACDGLDGAVARAQNRQTDFGGYLDIVLDFAFYGMIPFAFIVHDPEANGLAGGLLVLSFYVNGASFLAYATMAEKRSLTSEARGRKSLYFTTGLAEAGETLIVFVAACLFPTAFPPIAAIFAVICFYTALSRTAQAGWTFR